MKIDYLDSKELAKYLLSGIPSIWGFEVSGEFFAVSIPDHRDGVVVTYKGDSVYFDNKWSRRLIREMVRSPRLDRIDSRKWIK